MILCFRFCWKENQKQWWLYPRHRPGQQSFLVRNLNEEVRQWNAWRVWLGVTGGGWNWIPRDPVRNKYMDYTDNNLEGKAYNVADYRDTNVCFVIFVLWVFFFLLLLNIKKNESWFLISSLITSPLQEHKIFYSCSLKKKLKDGGSSAKVGEGLEDLR